MDKKDLYNIKKKELEKMLKNKEIDKKEYFRSIDFIIKKYLK